MEGRLDAPAKAGAAAVTPASEPKSDSPLVQEDGPLFAKGADDKRDIDVNDVHQGRLGDCWLISAIGAMAKRDPESIRTLITAAPADADGHPRYRVTLYLPPKGAYADDTSKKQKQEFVVTTKLPLNCAQAGDIVDGKPELWVELIEKAFAVAVGGYEQLDGASYSGLSALTPNKTEKHNAVGISLVDLKRLVSDADSQGRPITLFMSVRKNEADESLVFEKGHGTGGHVFWVDHVEGNMVEIWEGHGHRVFLSFEQILAACWDFDIGPMPSVPSQ